MAVEGTAQGRMQVLGLDQGEHKLSIHRVLAVPREPQGNSYLVNLGAAHATSRSSSDLPHHDVPLPMRARR